MIKILLLCMLICSTCFAEKFVIEDFSANPNCKWIACKWGKRKNPSFKAENGIMKLRYAFAGEKVKKGFSFYAKLKKECDLGKYKYFTFRARSGNKKECSIMVYLTKEQPVGKRSSFYSIVRLTPEWKNYSLRLKSGGRSMVNKGFFVKSKYDAGASRQLDTGGNLKLFNFHTKTAEIIEIDNIILESDLTEEDNNAIAKKIKEHKKYLPYKFKKILNGNGPLLVKDGKSSFVIFLKGDMGEAGKFAALELAKYIEKSTGAKLTIVNKYSPEQKLIILSVEADLKNQEGFKTAALNSNEITICGNDQRGLLYGVYDFLEKALEVRWFAPFDYAEVVPEKKTVKLPLWQDESAPKMIYRRFHYCSAGRGIPDPMKHRYAAAEWCVKNRYNVELERLVSKRDKPAIKKARIAKIKQFYEKRGGYIALPTMWGHNYHYWVSPKKHFEKNPEYFCLDSSTGKWRGERAQLCATNPGVVKVIIKGAIEYFKKHPERKYFPLFQEDGSRLWCQCPKCLALYKGQDSNSYKTEHNINLANQVAAALAKAVPGKKVVTYAYQITSQIPQNVKLRDDVFVTYCLMDFSEPNKYPWKEFSGKELSAWSKLGKGNLILYTYHYLDFYYTAITSDALTRTFRYLNLLKIKCSCQESNENWYGVSAYNYYLGARLAWDPWFNEKAFRKDYYEKLYGNAAVLIDKYHNILENCLSNKKYWLEYGNRVFPHIPSEKLKAMQLCLNKAKAVAKGNQRVSKAVHVQCRGFLYVKAFSKAVVSGADFQKTLSEAGFEKAITDLTELEKVIKRLMPDRLVSFVSLRQTKGMRRNMRENHLKNSAFKAMSKKYNVLKQISKSWNFKIDPQNEGEKEKWFAKDFDSSRWKKIKTGNWWGKQGIGKYLGSAWYRIELNIPSYKKNTALYFCGVDERAWVYLDGKYIGGHNEGDVKKLWNEPFLIVLPKNTKPGLHQLTVKVHASAGQGGIWKPVFLLEKK
jgi:Domain of unknown function (DUF4838)